MPIPTQKGRPIPIQFTCPEDRGWIALETVIFKNWLAGLDPRFVIKKIDFTVVDFHSVLRPENILFVRMSVELEGVRRRQIVELRGNTCCMLAVLRPSQTGSPYTVLVRQPRLATGQYDLIEAPAGMIDGGNFRSAAVREIDEELGLKFAPNDLIDMTGVPSEEGGIYLSPGLLDECCRFYFVEKDVSWEILQGLRDQTCGSAKESERITLLVVPLSDIPKISRDAKTLLAYGLYQQFQMQV